MGNNLPTFQEYFAACTSTSERVRAIDDWHFFLTHVPHNPEAGIYRIFESRWKQVILLWLGLRDIALQEKQIVRVIQNCQVFYLAF